MGNQDGQLLTPHICCRLKNKEVANPWEVLDSKPQVREVVTQQKALKQDCVLSGGQP